MLILTVAVSASSAAAQASAAPGKPAAAAGWKHCHGGYNTDGSWFGRPGAFWRGIRARDISCHTARRTTKAWILARADHRKPTLVNGFRCSGRFIPDQYGNGTMRLRCTRGAGADAVRFFGRP
ncbi:MAG TPA: hypothetical protein VIL49_07205 [Capillimicrobium sp.]